MVDGPMSKFIEIKNSCFVWNNLLLLNILLIDKLATRVAIQALRHLTFDAKYTS